MADEELTDRERIELLSEELRRVRLVWNYFAGRIISGFYPVRDLKERATPWSWDEQERLFTLFKIMDHEVGHTGIVLAQAGTRDPGSVSSEEFAKIFDELCRVTKLKIPTRS